MSRTLGHAWKGRDPNNDGTDRLARRLRPAGRDTALFASDLALDAEPTCAWCSRPAARMTVVGTDPHTHEDDVRPACGICWMSRDDILVPA